MNVETDITLAIPTEDAAKLVTFDAEKLAGLDGEVELKAGEEVVGYVQDEEFADTTTADVSNTVH